MKHSIGILLVFICFVLMSFSGNNRARTAFFKGKVSCDNVGIKGVVVTDGVVFDVTNEKGEYSIPLSSASHFVYISSPAGYQVPCIRSVPQFFSSVNTNKKPREINFTLEENPIDDTNHGFVVWSDPQLKHNKELPLLKEAADDLSELLKKQVDVPFHGLGCGDIVGDSHHLYDSIKNVLTPARIPFYQSMGNHDMSFNNRSNEFAEIIFEEQFGPHYYSFNRGNVHYVILNNVFYLGRDYFYISYLPAKQLDWLQKDLSYVPHGKTVVVVMHIPSALDDADIDRFSYSNISKSLTNKNALYKMLKPYQAHIITGHTHANNNVIVSPNIFEHNVSSVCGAWWQGPYAPDGTPKGYMVFEAEGNNLKWYYKSIGKDKVHQFRAYAVGSNPEQAEYITANVWNWDPEWKIYWYEDGQRIGEMEAYRGNDPETAKYYADKDKIEYKWVSAQPTNHMFRAKPRSSSALIKVEVVDRFGNVYNQTL